VPLPPLPEQAAIVRFLDHADRRIRRYIRAKQKLVKLLEEQKQAIIHRAVTRGLDPNVRLKPSGVGWLGDVPEHWEVAALRRRWSVTDCKHLTVPFVEDDDGIPLASVREVQSFELSLATAKRTSLEHYESLIEGGRKPQEGDLIYCRNVSVGAAAIVTTKQPLAMGQDVCLIRSNGESQRYLNYFLRSPAMRHQLAMLLIGSTFNRINVADIKALLVVVPPRTEQDSIAKHLDVELAETVRAQSLATDEIALIREYRTRLIADVVTGKLDVREAAARLPEEVDEAEALDEPETEGDVEDIGNNEPDEVPEEAEA
jgi:type I restriction enzyme S subunit